MASNQNSRSSGELGRKRKLRPESLFQERQPKLRKSRELHLSPSTVHNVKDICSSLCSTCIYIPNRKVVRLKKPRLGCSLVVGNICHKWGNPPISWYIYHLTKNPSTFSSFLSDNPPVNLMRNYMKSLLLPVSKYGQYVYCPSHHYLNRFRTRTFAPPIPLTPMI